ncbi:hypothetical protein [Sphingomonas sp. DC2300-3]|uniref:hypothetical protein n=1 Tax=unclassified Sphingomonas TaxID=196159 RepID=UPI003CF8CC29
MTDDEKAAMVRKVAEQDYVAARAEATDRIKNQMSIADATMKALLLANGGAMIALFTFVGNLIAKSAGKPAFDAHALWTAFACFVAGLIAALLTHAFAFLSQERFYHASTYEVWRNQTIMLTAEALEPTPAEVRAYTVGQWAYCAAFVLAVVSIGCFTAGCAAALRGVLIG